MSADEVIPAESNPEPTQVEPAVPEQVEPALLRQAFFGESESVPFPAVIAAPKVYTGLITRSELEERIGEIKDALHRHGIG